MKLGSACLLCLLAFQPLFLPETTGAGLTGPSLSSLYLGTVPRGLAIDSNSGMIYTILYLNGTTLAIDSRSLTVVGRIMTPSPYAVAVNSATNTVYVSQGERASIAVFDGSLESTVSLIQGAGTPYALALDEGHNLVFGADTAGNSLWIIDGSTNTVAARVPMGDTSALAFDPLVHLAFIGNLSSDFKSGTIDVVDGTTRSIIRTFQIPIPPGRFALDPVSHLLFVTSGGVGGGGASTNFLAIDDRTSRIIYALHLGNSPNVMSVTPSSDVFVSDAGDNRLYELDGRTGQLLLNFTGESAAGLSTAGITGMAYSSLTGKLYITEREFPALLLFDAGTVLPNSGFPSYAYFAVPILIATALSLLIIVNRRRSSRISQKKSSRSNAGQESDVPLLAPCCRQPDSAGLPERIRPGLNKTP